MLRVEFRTGRGGKIRWFAANKDTGAIVYSCFPWSFGTEQEAWEHAQWAIGAGVSLEYANPDEGFVAYTGERYFEN